MSSRTLSWLVLAIMVLALAFRVQGMRTGGDTDATAMEQATIHRLRNIILERYVADVDEKDVFYGALQGMVSRLDQHSAFLPPDAYERMKTTTSGQFTGVGIELDSDLSKGLTVSTPLMGSPAYEGGILPGDRILKVDDFDTEGKTQEECIKRIKGPIGTPVTLTVLHVGEKTPIAITIKRAIVELHSVLGAQILGPDYVPSGAPKIGFVMVTEFQRRSVADLEDAVKKMEAEGMQALILDLRQNRGGLLTAAQEMADMFLADGLIMTTYTRAQQKTKGTEFYATKAGTHPDYPIAVLVDGGSASASEIVSGALQDRGRAVLVGEKTFGKFSVQDVIPVELGQWGDAALKLTIAKYKTPTGPCLDGQGIEPDYVVPLDTEQQKAVQKSRNERRLRSNDPRAGNGAAKPETAPADIQLKKAVEVLTGLVK